jgi:hypothetical protein
LHYIRWDSIDDKFWFGTGDNHTGGNNENIMTAKRTAGVWTFTIIGSGIETSIWENTGMGFDDTYFYICGEGTTAAYNGIRRLLRTDIANIATNQERIFATDVFSTGLVIFDGYHIMSHTKNTGDNRLTWSQDGINFITRIFDQLAVSSDWGFITCIGKLSNGYYLFVVCEDGETEHTFQQGSTLLIKPSLIS